MSSSHPFLQSENGTMLQRVLYKDVIRRYGGDLNEKQASRLIKTVSYWTSEVYRVQGNKPLEYLNKEVFRLVLSDYMGYLERNERTERRSAVNDIEEGPGLPVETTRVETIEDVTRMDVSSAFSALQAQRQEGKQTRLPSRDFQMDMNDEGTISLDVFERMKKERDQESGTTLVTTTQPSNPFMAASDMFSANSKKAQEEAEAAFAERERSRLVVRANTVMPVPPDMRSIILGEGGGIDRTGGAGAGAGGAGVSNQPDTFANLPQAILTRQPDVVSYKESEINLFLSSADRDWATIGAGTKDSRYNFSINFDPAGIPATNRGTPPAFPSQRLITPGSLSNTVIDNLDPNANFYPNLTVSNKFRNIVRIEFVKAILPGEGLDVFMTKANQSGYDSSLNMNVLSFPYIQVRIPELETNNYGTNQSINGSFALLQYDANWVNDTNNSAQRGFFAMIPKFLKCQKVYTPTPLGTLQKLSFQFQRPDGSILSSIPDTLRISTIIPTNCIANNFLNATASGTTLTVLSGPTLTVGVTLTGTGFSSATVTAVLSVNTYTLSASQTSAGPFTLRATNITQATGTIAASGTGPTVYARDTEIETNGAAYYWIQTSTWFNQYTVSKGDRVAVKNISWDVLTQITSPTNPTNTAYPTASALQKQINDIVGAIQSTTGLLVADIGTISGSGTTAVLNEGANSAGYANAIIVSGKLTDPTLTGTAIASSPGGIPDLSAGFAATNPYTSPSIFMANTPVTSGMLINLSHQTHIAMRIITRDVDSTGLLRPDNL
jgi:hypothetical protein